MARFSPLTVSRYHGESFHALATTKIISTSFTMTAWKFSSFNHDYLLDQRQKISGISGWVGNDQKSFDSLGSALTCSVVKWISMA